MSRFSQNTLVTTGLKCAPERGPKTEISTYSVQAVAMALASSATPVLEGESCAAMMPEPTTAMSKMAVPRNSASMGRPSRSQALGAESATAVGAAIQPTSTRRRVR